MSVCVQTCHVVATPCTRPAVRVHCGEEQGTHIYRNRACGHCVGSQRAGAEMCEP